MPTNRNNLSTNLFFNGAKPDRDAFAAVFDSFLHLTEDGLSIQNVNNSNYVEFDNGIQIGDMPDAQGARGALRFNGASNALEVHDGLAFTPVGSGEDGGGFSTVEGSEAIAFNGFGNVGIGTGDSTPAPYRLDVFLDQQADVNAADRNNQVRLGNAIISRGADGLQNDACFGHERFGTNRGYAMRHSATGTLFLNSTGTNQLLSQIVFTLNGTQTSMIINRQGRVGIGTISPSAELDVNGTVRATEVDEGSDARYKTNVAPIEDSLSKILTLNGVKYQKSELLQHPEKEQDEREYIGLIAQEVEAVLPEVVSSNEEGFKSMSYTRLVPVLIEAIKEMHQETSALKAQLEALQEKIN
ncbi:MAG: tail fiber domain-containing protein [Bacteroidota bacterium]